MLFPSDYFALCLPHVLLLFPAISIAIPFSVRTFRFLALIYSFTCFFSLKFILAPTLSLSLFISPSLSTSRAFSIPLLFQLLLFPFTIVLSCSLNSFQRHSVSLSLCGSRSLFSSSDLPLSYKHTFSVPLNHQLSPSFPHSCPPSLPLFLSHSRAPPPLSRLLAILANLFWIPLTISLRSRPSLFLSLVMLALSLLFSPNLTPSLSFLTSCHTLPRPIPLLSLLLLVPTLLPFLTCAPSLLHNRPSFL